MSKYVQKFTLQCIRETSFKYEKVKITAPSDAAEFFLGVGLYNNAEEVLLMATLDAKNCITGLFEVARGALDSAVVHPREVFKRAITANASSILIAHNHPSGDETPSPEDIKLTVRLGRIGKLIGIKLLDHIILGEYSHVGLMAQCEDAIARRDD